MESEELFLYILGITLCVIVVILNLKCIFSEVNIKEGISIIIGGFGLSGIFIYGSSILIKIGLKRETGGKESLDTIGTLYLALGVLIITIASCYIIFIYFVICWEDYNDLNFYKKLKWVVYPIVYLFVEIPCNLYNKMKKRKKNDLPPPYTV